MVAAGYLGRKSGRGFYDYAPGCREAGAADGTGSADSPASVTRHGELRMGAALATAGGIGPRSMRRPPIARFPQGALPLGDAAMRWLSRRWPDGDGASPANAGVRDVVTFDLAFDYAKCTRLARRARGHVQRRCFAAAVGALQAAASPSRASTTSQGLVVLRTVAMLANEAADAVTQGIASASRRRPRACKRASTIRAGRSRGRTRSASASCATCCTNLAAHYGEDRYRLSPLIARRCASDGKLSE